MADKRIIMKNGGMQNVVHTSEKEKQVSKKLNKIDELMLNLRDRVRNGEILEEIGHIEI